MPTTTNVVSSNPVHGGYVYSIQLYVIQFVSDLRQIGGFLRFPSPIKLTYCWKWRLNTIIPLKLKYDLINAISLVGNIEHPRYDVLRSNTLAISLSSTMKAGWQSSVLMPTFYWSAYSTSGKWTGHLCVRGIEFASWRFVAIPTVWYLFSFHW